MVTDWYQALTYRKCPRAFEIGYIQGAQLREMPVAQSTARFVRDGIRAILGGQDPIVAAAEAQTAYMSQVRERGLAIDHAKNNSYYRASVVETATIDRLVGQYQYEWERSGYKVCVPNLDTAFEIAPKVKFTSNLAAILEKDGLLWLLHIKVPGSWDAERVKRLPRDFELLSELASLKKHIAPNAEARSIGGAIVQVLTTGKGSMQHPFIVVPYDEELVNDWLQQVSSEQEQLQTRIDIVQKIVPAIGDTTGYLLRFGINQCFPQYQHSCDYPYPCEFRAVCWGDLRNQNPLDDPRYMPRESLVEITTKV